MADSTSPSALLVNYCGCPSSFDSLMPDNGLANLAGSLKRAGWSVRVMDYATTEMIGRLVPAEFRRRLRRLLLRFVIGNKLGLRIGSGLAASFQTLIGELGEHARTVQEQIAGDLVADIRARNVRFVGFKLWTGAGQEGAATIASAIRMQCPNVPIFGGGPHVENFGKEVLHQLPAAFDVVALGEGEETIVHLAEYALGRRPLSDVPGIAYRRYGGEIASTSVRRIADLDTLAAPSYSPDIYPAMRGDRKLKMLMLDESRGCPYACHFCFHPIKSGHEWRVRQAARVADLMEAMSAETGCHTFRLAGSNPPPEHRRAIAEELIRRKAPFEYVSFGHTRSANEPFDLLRRSGCISLFFGVESGSQRILDRAVNKHTKVELVRENLIRAREAGIMTSASLIVPLPFDDAESLQETVDLMAEVRPAGVSVYLPIVMPGTAWYNRPEEFGIAFEGMRLESLMKYQVRFLMPPPLWDPLPYRIGGMSYSDMIQKATWVSSALDKRGVLTGMNDSLLLLSKELGISPTKIRSLNRKLFMTADREGIEALVARFNARVCRPRAI